MPIYRGSALVRCPFSKAAYLPEHNPQGQAWAWHFHLRPLAEIGLERRRASRRELRPRAMTDEGAQPPPQPPHEVVGGGYWGERQGHIGPSISVL